LRAFAATLALVFGSTTARAQTPRYAEYRADVIAGNGTAVQAGAGLTIPMGIYVRLGLLGAAGVTLDDGAKAFSGRTDAIARFTLDPFREMPYGLSLGGGVSVPYGEGARVRPYLTAVIDVEGRRRGRLTPALQVGLGGGTRVGLAFRTSRPERR
jgi:hypothetical protein